MNLEPKKQVRSTVIKCNNEISFFLNITSHDGDKEKHSINFNASTNLTSLNLPWKKNLQLDGFENMSNIFYNQKKSSLSETYSQKIFLNSEKKIQIGCRQPLCNLFFSLFKKCNSIDIGDITKKKIIRFRR